MIISGFEPIIFLTYKLKFGIKFKIRNILYVFYMYTYLYLHYSSNADFLTTAEDQLVYV